MRIVDRQSLMAGQLHTHPGILCTAGDRAVELALELGRARLQAEMDRERILELEAQLRDLRKAQPEGAPAQVVGADPPITVLMDPPSGDPLGFHKRPQGTR